MDFCLSHFVSFCLACLSSCSFFLLEIEDNVSEVIHSASSPQPHRRTLSSVLKRLSNILDTRGQVTAVILHLG